MRSEPVTTGRRTPHSRPIRLTIRLSHKRQLGILVDLDQIAAVAPVADDMVDVGRDDVAERSSPLRASRNRRTSRTRGAGEWHAAKALHTACQPIG